MHRETASSRYFEPVVVPRIQRVRPADKVAEPDLFHMKFGVDCYSAILPQPRNLIRVPFARESVSSLPLIRKVTSHPTLLSIALSNAGAITSQNGENGTMKCL